MTTINEIEGWWKLRLRMSFLGERLEGVFAFDSPKQAISKKQVSTGQFTKEDVVDASVSLSIYSRSLRA